MHQLAAQDIVQGAPALGAEEIARHLSGLDGWALLPDGTAIRREWRFRSFKAAAQLAALAAWQAECANHHPDILFGWGHASVTLTTHSAGGVTLNDLIMAARLNVAAG